VPLDQNAQCTVCIPTYNQSRYLREAVISVAAQTAPVRLLVSNDASPDDTRQVIEELQQQYSFDAFHHPTNLGISANLQWLLRQPATPFIMRLDSDDLLHPGYIQELSALLERFPEAGYAHCAVREINGEGRTLGERRLARLHPFQDGTASLRASIAGYQVAANILLFRREALQSVNFGAGSAKVNFVEDYDLSIRLADAEWGNVYSGNVLASYRMWSGSSRPVADRKLTEVRGLAHIYAGSLSTAFARRRWSFAPVKRRRILAALQNSEILDRATFAPGQRQEMVDALLALAGMPSLKWIFAETLAARTLRRSLHASGECRLAAKRVVKSIVFRR
jgi:glycosyltransferase involved in cell wall biosynthesis